jgi:hypothetical protein
MTDMSEEIKRYIKQLEEIDEVLERCKKALEPCVGAPIEGCPPHVLTLMERTMELMLARSELRNKIANEFGVFVM